MATPQNNLAEQLINIRSSISEQEADVKIARTSLAAMRALAIGTPSILAAMGIANLVFGGAYDLSPYWTGVGIATALGVLAIVGIAIASAGTQLLKPRQLELQLDRLYDEQALLFSGRDVSVQLRQYAFRGAMQRNVAQIRKRGDRYRGVNNAFQSAIIVGSLATTTAASLSPSEGPLKWVVVVFSLAVGLSAGFTGYFKYRERAFYLRQTADDIEEQLNAYDLGLPPYGGNSEEERIAELTARIEALRVAQQQREQQLDQPKASTDPA